MISDESRVETLIKKIKKHKPDYILYRDKSNTAYEKDAKRFLSTCRKVSKMKVFLHSDFELAKKLHADGIHLTSTEFHNISKAKKLGLLVIISTHTKEEVLKAESCGADYVTYSPIFFTPFKGEPQGIKNLELLMRETKIKLFALGGIVTQTHKEQIKKTDAYGFASIRFFDSF